MYVFWTVGKGRNVIVSRDKTLCLQKVKFLFSFLCIFSLVVDQKCFLWIVSRTSCISLIG